MGSKQNFLKRHNPGVSKACGLNLEKKNKTSAHQKSQPRLLSYFPKKPRDNIPPTIPMLTSVIPYAMESVSQFSGTHTIGTTPITAPSAPNKHTINILAALEKEVECLPLAVLPDASESDEIALFSESVPTNLAKDKAWEYLDLMLNCFLGFNRTAESIYNKLQGGVRGLSAMVRYLKEFVGHYEINGALLEGKIQRLVNVIRTQCVAITISKNAHI